MRAEAGGAQEGDGLPKVRAGVEGSGEGVMLTFLAILALGFLLFLIYVAATDPGPQDDGGE